MPTTASDAMVLNYAVGQELILITCNRDDFVALAATTAHHGIIVLFRRKSRAAERSALLRLLTAAGEQGITNNITFA